MNNFRRRTLLSSSGGLNIDPTAGRKTIGGYQVVDLGLPNGLLFATYNVGATNETDYGDLYPWGTGAADYISEVHYYTGTENPLPSSADTATQVMGSGWRMPTNKEYEDLIDNTNYKWVENFNGSGLNGGIFISKQNPKAYVFFPAFGYIWRTGSYGFGVLGYYWSSTPGGKGACYLESTSTYAHRSTLMRDFGQSVRGVHAAV